MDKSELNKKLDEALEYFKMGITQVRTGRATPTMLESLKVSAYDTSVTVKELGTISIPEPQLIVITPWDKSLLPNIGKAVEDSDLNLNPMIDEISVRVPVPELTENRRKELSKLVASKIEGSKQAIRRIRQEAMKSVEKLEDEKKISEDDRFSMKDEYDEIIKNVIEEIERIGRAKKNSISELSS